MKGSNARGNNGNSLLGKQRSALTPAFGLLLLLAFFLCYFPSIPRLPDGHVPPTQPLPSPHPANTAAATIGNKTSVALPAAAQTRSVSSSARRRRPARPTSAPACDVSKGQWVRDPNGPYYTNTTCRTIQEHQNCLKFGRPDRDFLNWRWKPDGCELPLFDPLRFLDIMKGKSMAFVGDSLARNQLQSLMCLLSRVEHAQDISDKPDENFKRMFYPSHNVTLSNFWSPFLVKAEEGHLQGFNWSGIWNVYLDEPDDRWVSSIHTFDHVVVSSGNWFTRPSLFFVNHTLVGSNYFLKDNITTLTMHYGHRKAFRTALSATLGSKGYRGTTILRAVSPSHFENGEWNTGGDCTRTRPFGRNETALVPSDVRLYEDQMKELGRAKGKGQRKGLEFRVLDVTRAMSMRPDGHPSRYGHLPRANVTLYNDCVHWCLPGPVDMWNDLLLYLLTSSSS